MTTTGPEPAAGPSPADVDALAADLGRVADRLRTLSQARLGAPVPGWATRAGAARALAQTCADAAADQTGQPRRPVPVLSDLAVGDQVAVCGTDLVQALRAGPIDAARAARLAQAREQLEALRRLL